MGKEEHMSEFVLVWVLMVFDPSRGALTYSPLVKTLEDCQRMGEFAKSRMQNFGNAKCVEINILRKAQEK
jgi:hypothetical protein